MERPAFRMPGFLVIGISLLVLAGVCVGVAGSPAGGSIGVGVAVVLLVPSPSGFLIVNPNEARVVQFFGRYVGSIRTPGYHWTWPFTRKTTGR